MLAPAWLQSSWLASQEPHEVSLALISPPLASQPGEAAPEEVLCRPPREAWPLASVGERSRNSKIFLRITKIHLWRDQQRVERRVHLHTLVDR